LHSSAPGKIVLAKSSKGSLRRGVFPAVTIYVGARVTRTPTYGFHRLTIDFAAMLVITELVEARTGGRKQNYVTF
jgi:hypothetical protein